MIASKIRIQDSDTRFAFKIHIPGSYQRFRYRIRIPDSQSRFTYRIRIQDSHTGFVSKLMPSSMNECMLGGAMQGFFSVADEGCPFDALCRVSFRGNMLRSRGRCGVSFREPMKCLLPGTYEGSPSRGRWRVSFRGPLPSLFMKFTWHAKPHYRYL